MIIKALLIYILAFSSFFFFFFGPRNKVTRRSRKKMSGHGYVFGCFPPKTSRVRGLACRRSEGVMARVGIQRTAVSLARASRSFSRSHLPVIAFRYTAVNIGVLRPHNR